MNGIIRKAIRVLLVGVMFMATNNVFNLTYIKERPKSTLVINSFSGVDYFNNPINVANNMAVDMNNMLIRDNEVQKRYGLTNMGKLNVRSVAHFKSFDKKEHSIGVLNEVDNEGNKIQYLAFLTKAQASLLINRKDGKPIVLGEGLDEYKEYSIFTKDEYAYVIGGGKYIRVSFKNNIGLCDIEEADSFAFIPTIYENIQEVSNNNQKVNNAQDFNMLSPLIRVTGKTHSLNKEDYVQGNTKKIYKYDLGVVFNDYNEYYEKEKSWSGVETQLVDRFKHYRDISLMLNGEEYYLDYDFEGIDVDIGGGDSINVTIFFQYAGNQIAWLEEETDDADRPIGLKLCMNFDPENIYGEGNDNWELVFPHYIKGNFEKITSCSIGTMYGNNGVVNLFLTGNKDYINMDWHSKNGNWTYFSDLDYCAYGNNTNPIRGYSILQDNTLVVLKGDTLNEPTMYFRKATYNTDSNGVTTELFPMYEGNIDKGMVSNNSIVSAGNDVIFIAKDGVYGIELNNYNSDLKYAFKRSTYIDKYLKSYDLSKASIFCQDNYIYLLLDDGTMFISDFTYKVKVYDGDLSFNYVWYKQELSFKKDFPNPYIYKVDNTMFINYGDLYKVTPNEYQDIDRIVDVKEFTFGGNGLVIPQEDVDKIVEYGDCDLKYTLAGVDAYCSIFNISFSPQTLSNSYAVSTTAIKGALDNLKDEYKYIDDLYGYINILSQNKFYAVLSDSTIEEVQIEVNGNNSLKLIFDHRITKTFKLCVQCPKKGTLLIDDDKNITMNSEELPLKKLIISKSIVDTYSYIGITGTLPVHCYYVTKPINFGTTLYNKCLHSITLTNPMIDDSSTKIAVAVNGMKHDLGEVNIPNKVLGGNAKRPNQFNFDGFDFEQLKFTENACESSITIPVRLRKIIYMRIMFFNDGSDNCKLQDLTMLYSFGFKNRGDK